MENVNIHYDIFTQITNIEIPEPKKENKNNNNSGGGVPSLNSRVATGKPVAEGDIPVLCFHLTIFPTLSSGVQWSETINSGCCCCWELNGNQF